MPGDESNNAEPAITKSEAEWLQKELRRKEVLAQLEEESRESTLGRLCRSKSFWYAVFGGIFFVVMALLLAWVARDLGWTTAK